MTLHRMVDGRQVPLTSEEEASLRAEWAAFEAERDAGLVRAIKDEAARRILARYPDWKQRTMIARHAELLTIRMSVATWTPAQAAEAAEIGRAWDWIRSVADASNALEARRPTPKDIADDRNWPQ